LAGPRQETARPARPTRLGSAAEAAQAGMPITPKGYTPFQPRDKSFASLPHVSRSELRQTYPSPPLDISSKTLNQLLTVTSKPMACTPCKQHTPPPPPPPWWRIGRPLAVRPLQLLRVGIAYVLGRSRGGAASGGRRLGGTGVSPGCRGALLCRRGCLLGRLAGAAGC
jgi:hypothetical protein